MGAGQSCANACCPGQDVEPVIADAGPGKRVLTTQRLDAFKPPADRVPIEEVTAGPVEVPTKNSALIFIKPHAVTYPVQGLLRTRLADAGIIIKHSVEIEAQAIEEKFMIDMHHGSTALRALFQKPSDLTVPDQAREDFEKLFGLSWDEAISQKLVLSAATATMTLGLQPLEVSDRFDALTLGVDKIKLGSGFFVGKVGGKYFVVNGSYLRERAKYTSPGSKIVCFLVEWEPTVISWGRFLEEVIGAADPRAARPGSMRGAMLARWEALGLEAAPDASDNGVHASAGPFEGMVEKMNWLGMPPQEDPFGRALLASGVDREMLTAWLGNPTVLFEGEKQSVFELLESLDVGLCLEHAVRISKAVA